MRIELTTVAFLNEHVHQMYYKSIYKINNITLTSMDERLKTPERMFLKQRKVIENSIKTLTRRGFFDNNLENSFGGSWQIKM